jgi:hypothetical protein
MAFQEEIGCPVAKLEQPFGAEVLQHVVLGSYREPGTRWGKETAVQV